jgi:4-hydroxybenzoate polyprenyltransferase
MTTPALILKTMRPRQWVKNLLLLAGLYFPDLETRSPLLFDGASVARAALGFAAFCLIAGGIYLINDAVDAPRDRRHPKKKDRPIASGELGVGIAAVAALLAAAAGLAIAFYLSVAFGLCASAYFVMQFFYTFLLKEVFLLDTLIISMGFVIRAVSGIIVLRTAEHDLALTPWFVICVLFLSLLLAFCKRRAELGELNDDAASHRKVLGEYSAQLLDSAIAVCATAAILAYALYTVESARPWRMMSTLPFVIYGVFRYLHLVYKKGSGGAPEETLFGDPTLLGTVALWGVALLLVFYPAAP